MTESILSAQLSFCLSVSLFLLFSSSVIQIFMITFCVSKPKLKWIEEKKNSHPFFKLLLKVYCPQLSYGFSNAAALMINCLYVQYMGASVYNAGVCVCKQLLIVTLYHGVFIGVCDVENVNFSHQADEAAIRHHVYMSIWSVCVW